MLNQALLCFGQHRRAFLATTFLVLCALLYLAPKGNTFTDQTNFEESGEKGLFELEMVKAEVTDGRGEEEGLERWREEVEGLEVRVAWLEMEVLGEHLPTIHMNKEEKIQFLMELLREVETEEDGSEEDSKSLGKIGVKVDRLENTVEKVMQTTEATRKEQTKLQANDAQNSTLVQTRPDATQHEADVALEVTPDQGLEHHVLSDEAFHALVERNTSTWTAAEWGQFLGYKEEQYRRRGEAVRLYCRGREQGFATRILTNSLVVAEQHGAAYCQVAKVASSTFCRHFIDLANVTEQEKHRWRDALQVFAPKLWPAPEEDLTGVWGALTSIVIVRHPMARLASVYYQKFVELRNHSSWAPLVRRVVRKYRAEGDGGDPGLASPSEFLRYVRDDLARGAQGVDQHWRPQHLSCPFCSLQFTVYARMEDLDQDSLYFFTKANLTSLIDVNRQLNRASSKGRREAEFWSGVDSKLVDQLVGPVAYKTDLDMFGYSTGEYFASLGITLDLDFTPGTEKGKETLSS